MPGEQEVAPALGYRFDLKVDTIDLGLFTKIDGLSAQYETAQIKEGGENGFVHTLRGRLSYGQVTLTRPVDRSSGELAEWFAHADPNLAPQRSTASISAYDGNGREVARWDLVGVYPVRYTGPQFQAGTAGVLTESLVLAHNGFGGAGAGAGASPSPTAVRSAGPPAPAGRVPSAPPGSRGLSF